MVPVFSSGQWWYQQVIDIKIGFSKPLAADTMLSQVLKGPSGAIPGGGWVIPAGTAEFTKKVGQAGTPTHPWWFGPPGVMTNSNATLEIGFAGGFNGQYSSNATTDGSGAATFNFAGAWNPPMAGGYDDIGFIMLLGLGVVVAGAILFSRPKRR